MQKYGKKETLDMQARLSSEAAQKETKYRNNMEAVY